jgi:hypothetical protein
MEPENLRDDIERGRQTRLDLVAEAVDQALHDALIQVLGPSADRSSMAVDRGSLHSLVRAFAVACRARGSSPEATLVALKRSMREIVPEVIDARPGDGGDEHELVDEIVGWCIAEYYRDD